MIYKVKIVNLGKIFFLLIGLFLIKKSYDVIKKSEKTGIKRQIEQVEKFLEQKAIFIGGSMSSGTSLVRSLLDVHPSVKCGPETKFIHLILDYMKSMYTNDKASIRFMKAAGIKNETLDKSVGLAVYYVMLMNIGSDVERVCNKETSNRRHIEYFKKMFPFSKFILVVRDGREMAYSLLTRLNTKFTFKEFYGVLKKWNEDNRESYDQCKRTGPDYCMVLRYDNLVKNPEDETRKMADFLEIEWSDRMLNHEKYIGSEIKMSKSEWSLKGMKKKINSDSIGKWIGNVPGYDQNLIKKTIDMLEVLGFEI